MSTQVLEAESAETVTLSARNERASIPASAPQRRRGRPLLVPREQVLEQIRAIARADGMFRVHFDNPALYARARRLFGSWQAAVREAGEDYEAVVGSARRRSVERRRAPK